jgi:hypothetical protein
MGEIVWQNFVTLLSYEISAELKLFKFIILPTNYEIKIF